VGEPPGNKNRSNADRLGSTILYGAAFFVFRQHQMVNRLTRKKELAK